MNTRIKIIIISIATIAVGAALTTAILFTVASKKSGTVPTLTAEEKQKKADKNKADDAKKEAIGLINGTIESKSSEDTIKKNEEAIEKFSEAGRLYEQAGDKAASLEAKANADALEHSVAAESERVAKLEAEQAKQKAEMEAAKKAIETNNQ